MDTSRSLRTYRRLSGLPWPRSYLGKFLLTAFVGVHLPLIAVLAYVALRSGDRGAALPVLGVTLAATLAGTAATLYVQGRLLAPVLRTAEALDAYVTRRELPALPTGYGDEAGRLMRGARECIEHLDRLVRLRSDLLAVVSHDIRNPLTSISAANDLSRLVLAGPVAEPDLAELREYTDIIRDAARRQLDLMNNVLLLARSESGEIQVSRGPTTAGRLLRRTVDGLRLPARQKGVELVVREGAGDERPVELDVPKTEQVLANLVQNALKFTPAGGRVEVCAEVEGGRVEFRVRDSGVGIPPESVEHLFQPFSRARRRGTASEDGSGLGLWICRTFTEVQGGSIAVQSAPGEGSVFRVVLPCAPAASVGAVAA